MSVQAVPDEWASVTSASLLPAFFARFAEPNFEAPS